MAQRTPATFAKRQREMDKKRWADEKKKRKVERRASGEPPPVEECRPILD
jgi:hypothetical protein